VATVNKNGVEFWDCLPTISNGSKDGDFRRLNSRTGELLKGSPGILRDGPLATLVAEQ
jgi:hypothetical protein